jgi:DNA recombination protein RmuC
MTTPFLILAILILAALGVVIWLIARRKPPEPDATALMLSQQLEALRAQVTSQLEQGRQASERSSGSVAAQVQGFTKQVTELGESVKHMQESVKGVATFQELFAKPKMRGSFGELSLETILGEYFPRGGYATQYAFSVGLIVDAVLKLPSGQILPIDSKFSLDNFKNMAETEDAAARSAYRKQFLSDVKKRVDEIATKYILPSENTTDFALMYMPAEAIYYEVIQNSKDDDVAEYARKRKVLLTSPNTLYITLTAVLHWYKDAQVQKQTRELMKKIQEVIRDAGVLEKDFSKLGDHLSDASSAFERTEKKLTLMTGRAQKVIDLGEEQALLKEAE